MPSVGQYQNTYTSYATTTNIWREWTSNCASCTASTVEYVRIWNNWIETGTANTTNSYYVQPRVPPPETAEEREARRERTRRIEERRQERAEQQRAAGERARDLLKLILSDEQWESFVNSREFRVIGSDGGRYRITYGTAGNVFSIAEDESVLETLCAHPPLYEDGGTLPTEDVLAAQVLALRHDEAGFREVANITRRRHVAQAA